MGNFLSTVSNAANKGLFWAKQNAPQIMIVGGVVGGAVTTGLAIYATLKAQEPINEARTELEAIEDTKNKFDDYSDEAMKKDKKVVYKKLGKKLVKLYAPAAGVGIASAACVLGGTGIINQRYTNTAIGLASVTSSFKEYRQGVIDKYGEDVDKQIRYGLKEVEVKEKVTDENGKTTTVKKKLMVSDNQDTASKDEYYRIFDCSNPYWQNENAYNFIFLNAQQSYFNDMLRINGHVFLNDVLRTLGYPTTRAGQEVGWNYLDDNSDGYIDFHAQEINIPITRIDKNGEEYVEYRKAIALDFNVDGSIINKVDWNK